MSVLCKMIYRLKIILIKIPVEVFVEINELIRKFISKCKGPRIIKTTLEKEEESWRANATWFQDLESYGMKILWQ